MNRPPAFQFYAKDWLRLVVTMIERFHSTEFSPRGSLFFDWAIHEVTKLEGQR